MPDPTPHDPGRPIPGPDGAARPRKRKRVRVRTRLDSNSPEVRRAKLFARLTSPSLWMWLMYAALGLAVTVFILSRSIGRAPAPPSG